MVNRNKIIEVLENNTSNNQIIVKDNFTKIADEILYKSNDDLKFELKQSVENWVDRTFNFINIDVIKHSLTAEEEYLEDLIEPLNVDYDDFFSDFAKYDTYKEWCKENEFKGSDSEADEVKEEFSNQDEDFEIYKEQREQSNFPMWNTCFEIKNSSWTSLTEAAKKVGCGVINESSLFNDIIFMSSCGHSFYSSYWIPMYLELFKDEAKKYKGIDYQDL